MSLLIKALKKAEQRHQAATAKAIEQVSTDPTLQAAAEGAQAVRSQADAAAASAASSKATEPKRALSLEMDSNEPARPATSSEMTPMAIEAMHLARAHAQTGESPALPSLEPLQSPAMTLAEPVAAAMPAPIEPAAPTEQSAAQADPAAPVQSSASPGEPQAKAAAPRVPDPAASRRSPGAIFTALPAAAAQAAAQAGGKGTMPPPAEPHQQKAAGKERSRWIRLTGITMAGSLLAGGFLAWQATRTPHLEGAPPPLQAPIGPTPEQLREAYGNKDGKVETGPAATRKDSAPAPGEIRVKAAAREEKPVEARKPAQSLESRVGPQMAMTSPSTAATSRGTPGLGESAAGAVTARPGPAGSTPSASTGSAGSSTPSTPSAGTASGSSAASTAGSPGSAPGLASGAQGAAPASRSVSPPPAGAMSGPRLIRHDHTEKLTRLLEQAYAASSKQDRRTARQAYEQVLELDRNNTDALLGLASLSAREGDAATAERIYYRVLDLDPNDASAKAGLASLRLPGDPAGQESQLRHLLAADPAQPSLQFALGNSLAAQGRWNEAQQAYFQAFSGDNRQPDYAFNLAISLERMRQGMLALNYYRNALELARSRPARFNQDLARRRIDALERQAGNRPPASEGAGAASSPSGD